jgi:oligoendopeptidase F
MKQITGTSGAERASAVERYLTLLKSGGSDHPMTLLQRAGVDLSRPETVRAVVDQLEALVARLDKEISSLKSQGSSLTP